MTALRPEREDLYGESPYESYGGAPDAGRRGGRHAGRRADPPTAAMPAINGRTGAPGTPARPFSEEMTAPMAAVDPSVPHVPRPSGAHGPPADDETMALRIPGPSGPGPDNGLLRASGAPSAPSATGITPGGRAERRKAAKRRGGRHGGSREAAPASAPASGRPLSRVEARRQARARKPSPSVIASRAIGEVFITTGVLMLLFVTYQLWWTNVRAHAQAGSETHQLQDDWANGKRNPGVFAPGQGFAILHIPRLDVVAPIAEGVSNKAVLDKGMVGHYGEGALKTAMPDARTGNFGLAAHRNTHGEPFRYINRLQSGDEVVVETQDDYFVYKVASMLPVTPPSNTSVLDPVPRGSGFTKPGRYITLTTCTPEFTSKYRLIVWGKMVEERPRSKGKPDALIE
ncbi:class E sortase [Streptomyces sp. 1222.5]|uniref:class E sortase n=1 Tax=Streptomyces sp. 1222.5 TaxID=1881026 RepID=UPI003D740E7E